MGLYVSQWFRSFGRVQETMYKEQYEKILNENVKQSSKKLKTESFIFQQDSDSNTRQRTLANGLSRTVSIASSAPDMNPIEYIWDELERQMKPYSPKNKDELWSVIQKESIKKSSRSLSTQC